MGSTANKSQCGEAGEVHLCVNAGRRWMYKKGMVNNKVKNLAIIELTLQHTEIKQK